MEVFRSKLKNGIPIDGDGNPLRLKDMFFHEHSMSDGHFRMVPGHQLFVEILEGLEIISEQLTKIEEKRER